MISYFDENKYYEFLMERLLECTEDKFDFSFFYNTENKLSFKENKQYLQIFIEFIYRCLKTRLLKIYASAEDFQRLKIKDIEHFTNLLTKLNIRDDSINFDELETYLWMGFEVYATDYLKNIAKECDLVAYEDDIDFSTEKGRKFRDKIEKVWADHGLPWDLKHPLFPVPSENKELGEGITDEQREKR